MDNEQMNVHRYTNHLLILFSWAVDGQRHLCIQPPHLCLTLDLKRSVLTATYVVYE